MPVQVPTQVLMYQFIVQPEANETPIFGRPVGLHNDVIPAAAQADGRRLKLRESHNSTER